MRLSADALQQSGDFAAKRHIKRKAPETRIDYHKNFGHIHILSSQI